MTTPTPGFSAIDRATWPDMLLVAEVALILRMGRAGLERQCWARTFVPAPFLRRPLRWRKADVIRFIDGGMSMRRTG